MPIDAVKQLFYLIGLCLPAVILEIHDFPNPCPKIDPVRFLLPLQCKTESLRKLAEAGESEAGETSSRRPKDFLRLHSDIMGAIINPAKPIFDSRRVCLTPG